MCYTVFVARTRVSSTALPAASHPPASTKKSSKSNHCHTSAIFVRNSFACHTYKNKGLKVLCLPHILQINMCTPVMVNQVAP
jgi:hypothetical protein